MTQNIEQNNAINMQITPFKGKSYLRARVTNKLHQWDLNSFLELEPLV